MMRVYYEFGKSKHQSEWTQNANYPDKVSHRIKQTVHFIKKHINIIYLRHIYVYIYNYYIYIYIQTHTQIFVL